MRKLKVLERLFYRPLLDEERSHMPREMVERLFPNLEEVSVTKMYALGIVNSKIIRDSRNLLRIRRNIPQVA